MNHMRRFLPCLLVAAGSLVAGCATPSGDEAARAADRRMDDGAAVLAAVAKSGDDAVPGWVFRDAQAVVVVPGLKSGGLVFGGSSGRGMIVVRLAGGFWSNPVFVKVGGASVGLQAGVQSADLLLALKSERAFRDVKEGKFAFGAGMAVSAGPVGGQVGAGASKDADVYSYAQTRGLFAGINLSGGSMSLDDEANIAYYGEAAKDIELILQSITPRLPPSGERFKMRLVQAARKAN